MAKLHGKNTVVYVGGYDLTRYFSQADSEQSVDEVECTTFGATGKEYVLGHQDGSLSLAGYMDDTPSAVHTRLQNILGSATNTPVTVGWTGGAVSEYAAVIDAKEKDYKIGSPIGGVVSISVEIRADGGVAGYAKVLHALGAETATANGTGVDWGAGSTTSTGFDANIHVTAISGGITLDAKLQDSADNVTYADVTSGAFTSITAIGAENIGATTSVRRYTRVAWTITGTGSVTFVVALAKRV